MKQELCVRIKALRKSTGVTLHELSEKTHIPLHHLRALEKCEYHKLPEGVYRKALVKKIVKALDSKPESFVSDLVTHECETSWKECVTQKKFNLSTLARGAVIFLIVALVGSYLGMHLYGLLRSPILEIQVPAEGQVVHNPIIEIKGKTDSGTNIHINGIEVLSSNSGIFEQDVALHEGNNEILIVAKKKLGATTEIVRSIIFDPKKIELAPEK